jgi:uncharacterized membrane protein YdjX (TVP38/TMEM64 family)
MKRYIYFSLVLVAFFLLTFSAVEYFNVPLLKDPAYLQQKGGIIAAAGGFLLLVADIILPVPGSLIMIGNGALFGIWLGTFFSVAGGMTASAIGFRIGKKGSRLMNRFMSEKEKLAGERMMQKWGSLAIIVTRPVPLLSETVIIIAGTTEMSWKNMLLSSLLGFLPGAFIYSLAGASAISADAGVYSFLIVLGVAGVFWLAGKFIHNRSH